ncbi:MAG: hypothetical protein R3F61_37975 [Myxococcota bacterium]
MWFVLLALSPVFAGDPGSDLATPEGRQAEYVRLAEEMDRAVKRNNMVQVERLFEKLDTMGLPHSFPVLVNAAHAARSEGDILTAKKRLSDAQRLQESEDIVRWLWDIQNDYGPVMVAADLPDNYRLECKQMPFEPEHRRAVQYAQERVLEDSFFEGLLPRGEYVFRSYGAPDDSPRTFAFTLRADRQRFDLRTKDVPTRGDRKKRARIDRRVSKQEAANP